MFTRQGLLQTWRDIRPYFIFAAILFFAGIVVGSSPGSATEFLRSQIDGLAQMAEAARDSESPRVAFFVLIVFNNVVKSIMTMFLGVIGAILPLVMLVSNGMILGFLMSAYVDQGINIAPLIVKGLLPHGILELPALFLAGAFGIRFGVTLLRGMYGSVMGKPEPWKPFVRTATGSVPGMIVVTALLVAAAVVESTFTYWLMQ